jgi:HlyD family secretion protein
MKISSAKLLKILTVLAILGIVAVVLYAFPTISLAGGLSSAAFSEQSAGQQLALVTTLTDSSVAEASGSIEARQRASLTWETSGIVAEILVQPGDLVQPGQLLARLEPDSAPASVIQARAQVVDSQQALDELLQPSAAALAQARQDVALAYQSLHDAQTALWDEIVQNSGYFDEDLYSAADEAEADWQEAQDDLPLALASFSIQRYYQAALQTQRAYADLQGQALAPPESSSRRQAQQAYLLAQQEQQALRQQLAAADAELADDLLAAQLAYETALADLMTDIEGWNLHEASLPLASARAAVAGAEETLNTALDDQDALLNRADPDDLARAEANLQAAQSSAASLDLVAPFSGEILAVYPQPGDQVSQAQLAIVIADRSRLHVQVSFDESDVARLALADPVALTFDALPGLELQGQVEEIEPFGQLSQGLVQYSVRIELVEPEPALLLGMTANAAVITGVQEGALAVPLFAVQFDQQGEYVLRLLPGGALERVPVVSGQHYGDLIVVEGSLQPGDQVQIAPAASLEASLPFGG